MEQVNQNNVFPTLLKLMSNTSFKLLIETAVS